MNLLKRTETLSHKRILFEKGFSTGEDFCSFEFMIISSFNTFKTLSSFTLSCSKQSKIQSLRFFSLI